MNATQLTRLLAVEPSRADRRIALALRFTAGDISKAAQRLGVSKRTLYRIMVRRKKHKELAARLQAGLK